MRLRTVTVLILSLGVLFVACASSPSSTCQRPEWSPGDPATVQDVVLWSAIAWAARSEQESAFAPCGGGLSCQAVEDYARALGGRIYSGACLSCCEIIWLPDDKQIATLAHRRDLPTCSGLGVGTGWSPNCR